MAVGIEMSLPSWLKEAPPDNVEEISDRPSKHVDSSLSLITFEGDICEDILKLTPVYLTYHEIDPKVG
jgi:hypothetical protein